MAAFRLFHKKSSHTVVVRRRLTDDNHTHTPAEDNTAQERYASRRQQFRRNQTITGSSSGQFESAGERSAQIQSPRATEHALRHRQRRLGVRLFVALVASLVIFGILYQLIATVEVSPYGQTATDTSPEQKYQSMVNQYLSEHPFERLRFLLDTPMLVQYMQANGATEVQSIMEVTPSNLGVAHITIKMREPVASWSLSGQQEFVDKDGVIFATNYYKRPSVAVVDESGVRSDQVKTIASSRFLQFVGLSVGLARQHGLEVTKVVIPGSTTRQVQFELSSKTRIKLSVDRPAGEQVEDAARAVSHLVGQGVKPGYIDVRISGKAYYQ